MAEHRNFDWWLGTGGGLFVIWFGFFMMTGMIYTMGVNQSIITNVGLFLAPSTILSVLWWRYRGTV